MRLRDMSPGSAAVWYALLVNASMMRRSVLASTTRRLQPAAFIGTIATTTSRTGRGSIASQGPARGGRRATTREVFMGFRSPWFSSSRATASSGVQRLQPWWQRHHHRLNEIATKSRFATTPTASAAGAERESGIPRPTAAGDGVVVEGGNGGSSDKSATPAAVMKVTLLSGFLGAGKTTLMSNVLRQAREEQLSLAVIVNDMADINVDAQILTLGNGLDQGGIAAAGASGSAAAGESSSGVTSVAMQDGCICCTLKDELLLEVGAMAKEGKYDHLIIESTGISDPAPVAEALVESDCSTNDIGYFFNGEDDDDDDDESTGSAAPLERGESEAVGEGGGEGGMYSLDTLVTVVDSTSFLEEVRKADDLEERGLESGEGDTRTVADLLMSQANTVEFANVILLNKSDLATEEDMAALEGLVRRLNPTARVERTVSSAVGLTEVLGTGEFDLEEASKAAGWLRGLSDDDEDHPHSHYGIESFTFRSRRPFHPERLMGFVMEHLPSVLRSKGFLWLATREDSLGVWNQAGGSFATEYGGLWDDFHDADEQERERQGQGSGEHGAATAATVDDDGVEGGSARRNELVFIGLGMDEKVLRGELQRCLLSEEEMALGSQEWERRFSDPFPPWE
ncbi:unnamed protein product [Ectocarpus sp. CCAP 1310/34]|nr:unnamed protein product [Ectocarpus sp. CCAP 1310/34]